MEFRFIDTFRFIRTIIDITVNYLAKFNEWFVRHKSKNLAIDIIILLNYENNIFKWEPDCKHCNNKLTKPIK